MTSRKGRMLWYPMVVVYWSLAFVIGSAIPAIGALSGLGMLQSSLRSNPQTRAYSFFSVAAVCIFHFTYTFPPAMMLGLDIAIDAASADEPFTTPGVAPVRADTWRSMVRAFLAEIQSRESTAYTTRVPVSLEAWDHEWRAQTRCIQVRQLPLLHRGCRHRRVGIVGNSQFRPKDTL